MIIKCIACMGANDLRGNTKTCVFPDRTGKSKEWTKFEFENLYSFTSISDLKGYLSMETSLSNIEELKNLITFAAIENLRHAYISIKRHVFLKILAAFIWCRKVWSLYNKRIATMNGSKIHLCHGASWLAASRN